MIMAMDAVLPLCACDLPRARILFASLRRHAVGFGTLFIVSPARDVPDVQRELARQHLPCATVLLPEHELVPELARARGFRGWYRQQLTKLAIAECVATPHYLTLDADVICTRRVTPEDLAPNNRSLCHVTLADLHADWYAHSAAVLGLTPKRTGISHNVTPAALSREGVLALQAHLGERARAHRYRAGVRGLAQRAHYAATSSGEPWRRYLIAGAPWTEYALYYTFLEGTGRFERYHAPSEQALYSTAHSVWRADAARFDAWDPRPIFDGAGAPYFVVVQSITRLAPERIWHKVAPFLEESSN